MLSVLNALLNPTQLLINVNLSSMKCLRADLHRFIEKNSL